MSRAATVHNARFGIIHNALRCRAVELPEFRQFHTEEAA